MLFYGEIIDRMVTNRRMRDGWLNDRRLSARAPFEISTNIFLVAKAFSCFFLFFFFCCFTWAGHDNILCWKFLIVNQNRNINLHLYAETGSLEFINIRSILCRSWTNHRSPKTANVFTLLANNHSVSKDIIF